MKHLIPTHPALNHGSSSPLLLGLSPRLLSKFPPLPAPSFWAPSYLALLPPRATPAMLFHILQVSVEFAFPERDTFSSSCLLPRHPYILPEAALSPPCSLHHVLCVPQ